MNYSELYNSKKCTAEQAVHVIQNGDNVFTGGDPTVLLKALYDERETFSDVHLYSMFGLGGASEKMIYSPEMKGHVSFTSSILPFSASFWPHENIDHIPVHFSEMEDLIAKRVKPAVVLLHGCTMDDDGFIYLGNGCGCARGAVDAGAKVVIQINEHLPMVYTDYYRVHISEVTALVEAPVPLFGPDIPEMPVRPISQIEETIAGYICEMVPNGATIQLGAGGVPNAVGKFLENHKDLGIHTEVFTDSMTHLMKCGAVNNSKKTLLPGYTVAGFIGGGPETLQYCDHNRKFLLKKVAWVNSPMTICRIHDMMSINSCLAVDLRGQVCAESIGMNNTGGIGGQLDFVEGARRAPGGCSFLAMHSSMVGKDGKRVSKINLALPEGSVVTTPRTDSMCIVTEYGVANLRYMSGREKVKALIAIAHPDFRDELRFGAEKAGWL